MAIDMTKEKAVERKELAPVSAGVSERASRIGRAIQERKDWFENLKPPCPQDGTLGKFIRYEGAHTRVHGIFRCKNRHEFNYASRAQPQK
ncbi:MAG: hypothetical protein ACC618_04720 [Patescibacteria group bacterium]